MIGPVFCVEPIGPQLLSRLDKLNQTRHQRMQGSSVVKSAIRTIPADVDPIPFPFIQKPNVPAAPLSKSCDLNSVRMLVREEFPAIARNHTDELVGSFKSFVHANPLCFCAHRIQVPLLLNSLLAWQIQSVKKPLQPFLTTPSSRLMGGFGITSTQKPLQVSPHGLSG